MGNRLLFKNYNRLALCCFIKFITYFMLSNNLFPEQTIGYGEQ